MKKGITARAATRAAIFAVLAAFCAGCPSKKKEEPPKPDPASPESYMNDEKFMGRLTAERRRHVELIRERNAIVSQMEEMVKAKMAEAGTEDPEAVRPALEKDPAWNDLCARCTNANAKVEAHSRERLGIVRERIAPARPAGKTPVSK